MTDQQATDDKPTARECVLLFLAHYVRVVGPKSRGSTTDLYGRKVFVLTPYYIHTKLSAWAFNQYQKRHLGATYARRWREIREAPRKQLSALGIEVEGRPPEGEDEPDSYNTVWDLTVDLDTFEQALSSQSPYTDYDF